MWDSWMNAAYLIETLFSNTSFNNKYYILNYTRKIKLHINKNWGYKKFIFDKYLPSFRNIYQLQHHASSEVKMNGQPWNIYGYMEMYMEGRDLYLLQGKLIFLLTVRRNLQNFQMEESPVGHLVPCMLLT
jgi:hypothetical protein